jgi:hypothetical protein
MALTSATPASRVGQNLSTGTDMNELFLKVFSGEILTAFETSTIMKGLQTLRTISSGKSASFPVTGIASANYHTVGNSILETQDGSSSKYLSDIQKTEKQIFIDDMLVSSVFLANLDELKNHYDIRSIYASELGKALAKRFDIATMKTLFAASASAANIANVTAAGSRITSGVDHSTAQGIIDSLYAVAAKLDENEAPSEGRFAILAPSTYYKLITSDNVAVSSTGGFGATSGVVGGFNVKSPFEGATASGIVPQVAGISLFKSNHLVDIANAGNLTTGTDIDSNAGINNDVTSGTGEGYNSDFTGLVTGSAGSETYGIIAGTKGAIGTVKLLDLATESEYQIERQGTLFVAKYAMGHGILRPECAVSVLVD